MPVLVRLSENGFVYYHKTYSLIGYESGITPLNLGQNLEISILSK